MDLTTKERIRRARILTSARLRVAADDALYRAKRSEHGLTKDEQREVDVLAARLKVRRYRRGPETPMNDAPEDPTED